MKQQQQQKQQSVRCDGAADWLESHWLHWSNMASWRPNRGCLRSHVRPRSWTSQTRLCDLSSSLSPVFIPQ